MRYIKIRLLLPATLLLSGQTYATSSTGCTAKMQELENQISYAREYSNTHQIAGLQKALRETEEHCTETQLLKQRQLKIAEKEKKVIERQAELERAIETGNPRQMAQKKKKLDRAREELQDARNMLYQ